MTMLKTLANVAKIMDVTMTIEPTEMQDEYSILVRFKLRDQKESEFALNPLLFKGTIEQLEAEIDSDLMTLLKHTESNVDRINAIKKQLDLKEKEYMEKAKNKGKTKTTTTRSSAKKKEEKKEEPKQPDMFSNVPERKDPPPPPKKEPEKKTVPLPPGKSQGTATTQGSLGLSEEQQEMIESEYAYSEEEIKPISPEEAFLGDLEEETDPKQEAWDALMEKCKNHNIKTEGLNVDKYDIAGIEKLSKLVDKRIAQQQK